MLPDHLDSILLRVAAEVGEAALRERGVRADCSDFISPPRIDLPTAQMAAVGVVLADLQLV